MLLRLLLPLLLLLLLSSLPLPSFAVREHQDEAVALQGITIVQPRPFELLLVNPSEASDRNLHDVLLELNLDGLLATHWPLAAAETASGSGGGTHGQGGGHETAVDMDRAARALSCLTLRVVGDGFQTFDFSWPFPLAFYVEMRLGTHALEARLVSPEGGSGECAWAQEVVRNTPVSRTTFDLVPRGGVLRLSRSSASDQGGGASGSLPLGAFRGHRSRLPPSLARDCQSVLLEASHGVDGPRGFHGLGSGSQPLLLPPIRVVLLGSLHVAGQNLLALEQARRLRHLCVRANAAASTSSSSTSTTTTTTTRPTTTTSPPPTRTSHSNHDLGGVNGWRSFNVTYLSMESAAGPLSALLEASGATLARYDVLLTTHAVNILRDLRVQRRQVALQADGTIIEGIPAAAVGGAADQKIGAAAKQFVRR